MFCYRCLTDGVEQKMNFEGRHPKNRYIGVWECPRCFRIWYLIAKEDIDGYKIHATQELGSEGEPSEGQAVGFSKAEEGEL